MNIEEIRKNKPSDATHIDKVNDYWKFISDEECYFYRKDRWIRYVPRFSLASKKYDIKPL